MEARHRLTTPLTSRKLETTIRRLNRLEAMLVDAQRSDLGVHRGRWHAECRCRTTWAGDTAPGLRQRSLDRRSLLGLGGSLVGVPRACSPARGRLAREPALVDGEVLRVAHDERALD